MTDKEKAEAFDLICKGMVNGMSLFWENYDTLKGMPDDENLKKMGIYSAEEAATIILHKYSKDLGAK